MFATMTLTMGQRQVTAALKSDFTWSCEDMVIHAFLNSAFGPGTADASVVREAGAIQARRAARAIEDAGWHVHLQLTEAEQDAA